MTPGFREDPNSFVRIQTLTDSLAEARINPLSVKAQWDLNKNDDAERKA